MTCFTQEQIEQLLRAINGKRVSQDGKGFSHVEAYDIIAHLNRIFGFGMWSKQFVGGPPSLVFEDAQAKQGKNGSYTAWTVCYSAAMSLRVRCSHGHEHGPFEDAATGEAVNQPSRGDAHDLALKTSVSQALKRCCKDLGDQFGLSLYAKGSQAALVRKTLVMPDAEPSGAAVDSHITEQLPREDETPEPAVDPRVTNAPAAPAAADDGDVPSPSDPAGAVPPVAAPAGESEAQAHAQRIRQAALDEPDRGYSPSKWIAHLMGEAVKLRVQLTPVEAFDTTRQIPLRVFLEDCLKRTRAQVAAS